MEKYRYFFHNNLDLACFADLGGYFEEVNESFTKVLGYSASDLRDKQLVEFIHPDDIASTFKAMEELALGHQMFHFVNRFRTKNNTYRYLEWSSVVDLEAKKICAIARDVTDKVIANNELVFQNEEKEKRASELIIANDELEVQNGLKEKRTNELFVAYNALIAQNAEREKRAAELIIANKELAFQNAEKEKRAAELIIANKELIFQNEEKEKRAAELLNARSSLTKTEAYLREHIMGLEEMLAMTSHGVRQPVASILGIIHLLDKAITSPAEQKKLIVYIKQSAVALDLFIKKLTIFMYNIGKDSSSRIHILD